MSQSIRDIPLGLLSSSVLRSVAARFGFPDEQAALVELQILQPRSAARYKSSAILPVPQWGALHAALKGRDADRTSSMLPDGALLRAGALLHQRCDAADAAHRDGARSRRSAPQISAARVDDIGRRLIGGEVLVGEDLLGVPRFVRTQTTSRGLRAKGDEAIRALGQHHHHTDGTAGHYGDPLLQEAWRNLDCGPAAETAVEVLSEAAAADPCPCLVTGQLVYLDSPLAAARVAGMFQTHHWTRHDGVLHASGAFRQREPIQLLADRPPLAHAVLESATRYLTHASLSSRLPTPQRRLTEKLLAEARERLGGFTDTDHHCVATMSLVDRAGTPLDDDPIVPRLWRCLMLGSDSIECDAATQLLTFLGVAPEPALLAIAADSGLSERLRINAIRGLAAFGADSSEHLLRLLATDILLSRSVRIQSLWSYRSHGSDVRWMYSLLGDPDASVREALVYAARDTNAGVVLASTTDVDTDVAHLAVHCARQLGNAGRLGLVRVDPENRDLP